MKDNRLSKAVLGSWYASENNVINVATIPHEGSGNFTTYRYSDKTWQLESADFQYTISGNVVTIKTSGGAVTRGEIAIKGNTMSLTTGEGVVMLEKFDGSTAALDALKKDIEDNWLETTPGGSIDDSSVFLTESDVKLAISGMYQSLVQFEINQLNIESIRISGNGLDHQPGRINPESDEVFNTWESAYKVINMANIIIDRLKDARFEPYKNEALVIRCFVYYNIAMLWGQVPYNEQPNNTDTPTIRNFNQILDIISGQINVFASLPDYKESAEYSFGKEAVKAFMAEVALCKKDNKTALSLLKDCKANFSIYLNPQTSGYWADLLGEKIENYTADVVSLLQKEAAAASDLVAAWQSLGDHNWGCWAMLKRTGNAVAVSGCKDHELLLPIPQRELIFSAGLSQNPGY